MPGSDSTPWKLTLVQTQILDCNLKCWIFYSCLFACGVILGLYGMGKIAASMYAMLTQLKLYM